MEPLPAKNTGRPDVEKYLAPFRSFRCEWKHFNESKVERCQNADPTSVFPASKFLHPDLFTLDDTEVSTKSPINLVEAFLDPPRIDIPVLRGVSSSMLDVLRRAVFRVVLILDSDRSSSKVLVALWGGVGVEIGRSLPMRATSGPFRVTLHGVHGWNERRVLEEGLEPVFNRSLEPRRPPRDARKERKRGRGKSALSRIDERAFPRVWENSSPNPRVSHKFRVEKISSQPRSGQPPSTLLSLSSSSGTFVALRSGNVFETIDDTAGYGRRHDPTFLPHHRRTFAQKTPSMASRLMLDLNVHPRRVTPTKRPDPPSCLAPARIQQCRLHRFQAHPPTSVFIQEKSFPGRGHFDEFPYHSLLEHLSKGD
ncbi:hypothetical protein KM043_008985 [Ampulex compressa]|nr:hypothetical protein KM043_008985 [Ampulex compressa]